MILDFRSFWERLYTSGIKYLLNHNVHIFIVSEGINVCTSKYSIDFVSCESMLHRTFVLV